MFLITANESFNTKFYSMDLKNTEVCPEEQKTIFCGNARS